MKFGPVPLNDATGKILGHNIAGPDGRRALRKGKPLTPADIELLAGLGRATVYVAEMEAGDVREDEAARQIATVVAGDHLRQSGAATGRLNLFAESLGLLRVDSARLRELNALEGITLATLPHNLPVRPGKMVGTIKILPYAVPGRVLEEVAMLGQRGPLLWLTPLPAKNVALILSGSPSARERIEKGFYNALQARLEQLGSTISATRFIPLEDEQGELMLAETIAATIGSVDMVVLAGETAIMDRYDIAPRAVERAGGRVTCFGAPVDPGNLLMLGYLGSKPVLGAPGCIRSPKDNIVDIVLPRLLAGDYLTKLDIIDLGHGGLLEDVPERPAPRSRLQ
ncbi:MAG: molybdopterin-binding protein [Ardenticatenales bacterium]|nr:molybdopterin-binding protein [Ardenticatenales bacterium]